LGRSAVLPLLAWGHGSGLSAPVELGRECDEPLNQRADFRDDGSETHNLRALGVADRVSLPARELPRMNGQKVEGILCFLKCTLNN
jgi:hypothetical protein